MLGGLIALLLWIWLSNLAMLFGAVLDTEVERARQLHAGIDAAEQVQLPLRDDRLIIKNRTQRAARCAGVAAHARRRGRSTGSRRRRTAAARVTRTGARWRAPGHPFARRTRPATPTTVRGANGSPGGCRGAEPRARVTASWTTCDSRRPVPHRPNRRRRRLRRPRAAVRTIDEREFRAWLWVTTSLLALTLFAVSVPLAATLYGVHLLAAFGTSLALAGALPLAVRWPWVAAGARDRRPSSSSRCSRRGPKARRGPGPSRRSSARAPCSSCSGCCACTGSACSACGSPRSS